MIMASQRAVAQSKYSFGIVSSIEVAGIMKGENNTVFGDIGYDKVGIGYQTGFRVGYGIHKNLSIQTGLSFVSHQVETPKIDLNPASINDSKVPQSFYTVATYKIYQVPLLASYYVGDVWRLGFTLGATYNYVYRVNLNSFANFNDGQRTFTNTSKISQQNQFLSALFGIGVEYKQKKYAIRAEPTACYHLFDFEKDASQGSYDFYSIGLSVCGYYFF